MIVIEHDYSKRPLQLFWMDGLALQAIAGQAEDEETTLLTEIIEPGTNQDEQQQQHQSTKKYPRRPALETLAEFKTTPVIHAGYAVTWYGLSIAGVYMTRKLITRGRGG
jgi:cytochrome oxidase assembly protein ShyY1